MTELMQQPYPYYNRMSRLLPHALVIALAVFLFLLLFSPFTVNSAEHRFSYPLICLLHALNAAFLYLVYFFLLNSLAPEWTNEAGWTVGKTILSHSLLFLLIGMGSFALRPIVYNQVNAYHWKSLLEETRNSFLLGGLIFAGFTLAHFSFLLQKYRKLADGWQPETNLNVTINQIALQLENNAFLLNLNEFLFACAAGNYVDFYFLKAGKVEKQLKRATLKTIEEQSISQSAELVRTHRSFLVNRRLVSQVTGNAQGYQLYFAGTDMQVPVSRSYISAWQQQGPATKP